MDTYLSCGNFVGSTKQQQFVQRPSTLLTGGVVQRSSKPDGWLSAIKNRGIPPKVQFREYLVKILTREATCMLA